MSIRHTLLSVGAALALLLPSVVLAYGQGYYQDYYQAYYQNYYQPYYQNYYQTYYQTYYQAGYSTNTGALQQDRTYTIMCTVPGVGSASASTEVTVTPLACLTGSGTAPASCSTQCHVKAANVVVLPAQTTTLSWCCPSGPSSISNSGAGSTVVNTGGALSGSATVAPGTYTLTCLGGTGATTVVVDENAGQVLTFSATPPRVRRGQQSTLAWSTVNMTSCTLKDQTNTTVSTAANSAGLTVTINTPMTYTLSCLDNLGNTVTSVKQVGILPIFQEI